MIPKKKFFFLSGFLIILLLGGGYGYYRVSYENAKSYEDAVQKGFRLLKQGDMKSIEFWREAVRRAPSREKKAYATTNLGVAYFLTSPSQGVSLLKDVAAEISYPPAIRAGAINYILQYHSNRGDLDFGISHIFNDGMWSGFYDPSEFPEIPIYANDLAIRKAYEWSYSIYPSTPAAYWVASWYAGWATSFVPQDVREEYIRRAQEWLLKADQISENESPKLAPGQIGIARLMKGNALNQLYYLNAFSDIEEISKSFNDAIELFEQDPLDRNARRGAAFARFYLAASLLRDNKAPREIGKILKPIYDLDSQEFIRFLKSRRNNVIYGRDLWRVSIIKIAASDPEFKAFLLQNDWTESDLSSIPSR